jgi:hypothetical protein
MRTVWISCGEWRPEYLLTNLYLSRLRLPLLTVKENILIFIISIRIFPYLLQFNLFKCKRVGNT